MNGTKARAPGEGKVNNLAGGETRLCEQSVVSTVHCDSVKTCEESLQGGFPEAGSRRSTEKRGAFKFLTGTINGI